LGDKTGGGFYKKSRDAEGKRVILELDLNTFEYKPQEKTKFPSLDAAKAVEDIPKRVKTLVWGEDKVGQFLWKTGSRISRYAANRIPEIADTIVEIDNALKWGFGWEIGVFEAWDAIGVPESVERMRAEGQPIPASVEKMLASGATSFYKEEDGKRSFYDLVKGEYRAVPDRPGVTILKELKARTGVIKTNPGASLIDLGDGVACVEFHSKMNSIGGDTVQMMNFALDEVEKNFVGLVVGNQGGNFSGRCEHHAAPARRSGRRVGRHQHYGRDTAKDRDASALFTETCCHCAVRFDARRRMRDLDARQSRACGGRNVHGPGRGRCRPYSRRLRNQGNDHAGDGRGCKGAGRGSARILKENF
jgi:3-hydroxyacyl-CoA dehydrogenase